MGTAELRNTRQELIEWINSLKDTSILNLLNAIKLSQSYNEKDWWDDLTPAQKENIELGIKDLEEGHIISSKEFWSGLQNG